MLSLRPRIIVLQSCDEAYAEFLAATLDVNAAYAQQHGYEYRAHVGNLSPIPSTGNYNRYYLLREELERGACDWALWLDVDAIVTDHDIPLESIIDRTPDVMLVACRGMHCGDHDINNGVFLLNLRHGLAGALLEAVIRHCERLDPHNEAFCDDQFVMHEWLLGHEDPWGQISFVQCYKGDDYNLLNYDGPFIRHVLRRAGTDDERVEILRQIAAEIQWNPHSDAAADRQSGFAAALNRLTGALQALRNTPRRRGGQCDPARSG